MLNWAVTFLVIAVLAGVFGFFGDLPAGGAVFAKILFYVFALLFILNFFIKRQPKE